ncbi:hypothetical protein PIN31009_00266 [Pandoraea iniqua]|uniref:hypothetical protein n=1 Tax=Pandoraea iniqua TaxID=2508288 RepID=UPI00124252CA|nr:hypothetical protein [Pandoraea iniqua]VVD64248.1 hypothetical protein PIN31009_00266 [Pandoraea iniqua]
MNPVSRFEMPRCDASAQPHATTPATPATPATPTLLQRVYDARVERERQAGDITPRNLAEASDNDMNPADINTQRRGSDDDNGFDVASVFRDIWIRKQWVDWLDNGRQRYQEIGGM